MILFLSPYKTGKLLNKVWIITTIYSRRPSIAECASLQVLPLVNR